MNTSKSRRSNARQIIPYKFRNYSVVINTVANKKAVVVMRKHYPGYNLYEIRYLGSKSDGPTITIDENLLTVSVVNRIIDNMFC